MYIADFHIHSKYSRATSKNMNIENLAQWAKYKGINLLGTGDFTHFLWFHELKENLNPSEQKGIYNFNGVDFILTSEVCNIFDRKGKSKRIHNIIFFSSIEKVENLNRILEKYGDLNADGRPMLHIESKELVKIVEEVDENGFVVPAHIWTPHFSLFGSNSGFDRIEDCFGNMTEKIFALETGLSSDPEMNWRLSSLDTFALISNSDAHSPGKLGREVNVFKESFDFLHLKKVLIERDTSFFLFTVEYFPQEGKYHFDGHRNCGICFSPDESIKHENICPACGRKLTIGVMHRVNDLADRKEGEKPEKFVPFKRLVPLDQIIGFIFDKAVDTVTVKQKYADIVNKFKSEFNVLLEVPPEELSKGIENEIAEVIIKVRNEEVNVQPGYDGEFGKVEIPFDSDKSENQQTLF